MANLGTTVRDKVTGFTGIVTGHVEYLTGCNQSLVVPKVGDDGRLIDSSWFDDQRLEVTDADVLMLDNGATPGCDTPAPIR